MVRLTYYDSTTDIQVEVIDLPDNCSVRTAIRSLSSRGWEESNKFRGVGDKSWMFNTELARRVCIEERLSNEIDESPMLIGPGYEIGGYGKT